jgi:hypothetical protein
MMGSRSNSPSFCTFSPLQKKQRSRGVMTFKISSIKPTPIHLPNVAPAATITDQKKYPHFHTPLNKIFLLKEQLSPSAVSPFTMVMTVSPYITIFLYFLCYDLPSLNLDPYFSLFFV